MMLLNIYIAFSIFTFMVTVMNSFMCAEQLKREHAEIAEFYIKNKRNFLEYVLTWTKVFILCFIPIFNFSMFYVSMFKTEDIYEKFLDNAKGKQFEDGE